MVAEIVGMEFSKSVEWEFLIEGIIVDINVSENAEDQASPYPLLQR